LASEKNMKKTRENAPLLLVTLPTRTRFGGSGMSGVSYAIHCCHFYAADRHAALNETHFLEQSTGKKLYQCQSY
jgi:hypothetical protein